MEKRVLSVLGAGVALALTLGGCGSSSSAITTKTSSEKKLTHTVLYEVVGGQKSASVTIETPTGTSQKDISIPLKKTNTTTTGITYTFDSGSFVYISAQGNGGSNNIICRISVDGKVISRNEATGYGIATCKGTVEL